MITHRTLRHASWMLAGLATLPALGCLPEEDALASDPGLVETVPNPHVWSRTFYEAPFDIETEARGIRIQSNARGDVLIKADVNQSVVGFDDAATHHTSSGRTFAAMMDHDNTARWTRHFDINYTDCVALAGDGTVIVVNVQLLKSVRIYDADGFEQSSRKLQLPPESSESCIKALPAPSGALYILSASLQSSSYLVSKWDSTGRNLWRRQLPNFAVFDAALDSAENLIFAGGVDRVQVTKLKAADGNSAWRKEFGDDFIDSSFFGEGARGVAIGSNDEVYLTGNFRGSLPVGDDRPGQGSLDAFVAKLDSNGKPLWNRIFGGPDEQSGEAITVSDGAILVTGRFRGSIDFAAGPVSSYGVEKDDMFVAALDPQGNLLSSHRYGDSVTQRGLAIAAAPGGAVIGGIGAGTMTFGGAIFPPPATFVRGKSGRWFVARLAPLP